MGIVTEVKPEQFSNALEPIELTELGMVIEVKPSQPSNAEGLIETVPSLTEIDVPSGILPLYSYKTLLI